MLESNGMVKNKLKLFPWYFFDSYTMIENFVCKLLWFNNTSCSSVMILNFFLFCWNSLLNNGTKNGFIAHYAVLFRHQPIFGYIESAIPIANGNTTDALLMSRIHGNIMLSKIEGTSGKIGKNFFNFRLLSCLRTFFDGVQFLMVLILSCWYLTETIYLFLTYSMAHSYATTRETIKAIILQR